MMSSPVLPPQVLFLDYQVLDHMCRIETDRYAGTSAAELTILRQATVSGNVEVWMSKVTRAEMAIGLENPKLTPAKSETAKRNDMKKFAIAKSMRVRWLTFPACKSDDTYSRSDLTLRSGGLPDWLKANALEGQLLKLSGVSAGDARQVVSCLYGQAEDDGSLPVIRYFVSEDGPLRMTLANAQAANTVSELAGLQILSVKAFVDGMANAPA